MGTDIGSIVIKKTIELNSLAGHRVAIDAFNTIYQFLSIIRQRDGTPLMDSRKRVTSHLSGLLYRVSKLVEIGIKPIFVFDGEPPKFKAKTIAARIAAKEEAKLKMKEAMERGEEDLRTYAQGTVRINKEIIEGSKRILTLMGLPIIQAPSEGEAGATNLVKDGLAYAVGSQDYDSLLFGGTRLVRNITLSGKRKLPRKGVWVDIHPEMIDLNESLQALGIDRKQLIWLAMMVGTDYTEGIHGIGPKKGLKIVKEAKSLKQAYEIAKKPEVYTDETEEIERFFYDPPKLKTEPDIKFEEPQKDKLIDFLCGEHEFSIERVESAVDKMIKQRENKNQSSLDEWFG